MSIFAILLTAVATAGAAQCASAAEANRVLAATREAPTPLGLILGAGSDWGAKYLVVKTTHHLGVPGIPTREGAEKVTYYAAGRERTCVKELEIAACPQVDLAIRAYRGRSYIVMYNRSKLRRGGTYHPPFASLHAQDGDGSVINILSRESEHPLMHDTAQTFSSIESCTKDVDELVGGL